MIFKQEFIDMILSGKKTQKRRPNRGYYKEGHTYAIQPCRICKGILGHRIMMDEIWEEWCDYGGGSPYHILPANAKAEGGYTVEEFEKLFREINPKWDGQKRWAYKFHLVEVTSENK